jgi:formylglycine-generating enzyme required for sulfatase activity
VSVSISAHRIVGTNTVETRYDMVWESNQAFESVELLGCSPRETQARSGELAARGYRPRAVSVSLTAPDGPPITASVWERPLVAEEVKDRLAERQARAAVALVRLGRAAEVWTLLRHSVDPRLRSFTINWLGPLGADPGALVAELNRLERARREPPDTRRLAAVRGTAGPSSAPDPQRMDAILFDPETSTRRALILTLGTYGAAALDAARREPMIARLIDIYRNDPDAGIHGAVEWTLRQWGQQSRLKAAYAELAKLKERGGRRWFVNSQGQTFAVIDGPVAFPMGSPPTERYFDPDETLHRVVIPRRLAIAAKEVTVEQYRRFARKTGRRFEQPALDRFSPDRDGPMISVNWFDAAAYCNWLSKEEGLPVDQWCYLPNGRGEYAPGMRIPADALRRTGYRLPLESEWEYACRAGALTCRYYGLSTGLLDAYAWHSANSRHRTWSCGSRMPNDLGLFDLLGNAQEWCLERPGWPGNGDEQDDVSVDRLTRGGSFMSGPPALRSAVRFGSAPGVIYITHGFRLIRTYN